MRTTIDRLTYLCDTIPALLGAIPEIEFKQKPAPTKWSKQEELGHLIDSATNNHQRFIRGQFEENPFIKYSQDDWVACNHYNELDQSTVIRFWEIYNRHLIEVLKRIPADKLQRTCTTGGEPQTLRFLAEDYVVHQEHHLQHIVRY